MIYSLDSNSQKLSHSFNEKYHDHMYKWEKMKSAIITLDYKEKVPKAGG